MSVLEVPSLVDAVQQAMRVRILDSKVPPGAAVTEISVANEFSVARTTAKAAVERLVHDGLLRRATNKSARVPILDLDEVRDVYFSRGLLEATVMQRLAGDGVIPVETRTALLRFDAAVDSEEMNQVVESDIAFHRALVDSIGSERFSRMVIYRRLRVAAEASGRELAILADLQGPKIRLGRFADGPHEWSTGEIVVITVDDVVGTRDRVSTTYRQLADDARPGDRLLIDDGKVGLVVTGIQGNDVLCRVTEGGPVSNNKGLSLPGMNVSVPAMSDKDVADLKFALSLGVDVVALSFVRSPDDVKLVHQVIDEVGAPRIPVIAKIEKPEAVDNLTAIILAFDGIMVARGDLGVDYPWNRCPSCNLPERTRDRSSSPPRCWTP